MGVSEQSSLLHLVWDIGQNPGMVITRNRTLSQNGLRRPDQGIPEVLAKGFKQSRQLLGWSRAVLFEAI